MTEFIKNKKRLANKLQIAVVESYREIDCKPGIGKGQRLNNLPRYNAHLNCRENTNISHPKTHGFADGRETPNISRDIRNCLITSWGTNKPPPVVN